LIARGGGGGEGFGAAVEHCTNRHHPAAERNGRERGARRSSLNVPIAVLLRGAFSALEARFRVRSNGGRIVTTRSVPNRPNFPVAVIVLCRPPASVSTGASIPARGGRGRPPLARRPAGLGWYVVVDEKRSTRRLSVLRPPPPPPPPTPPTAAAAAAAAAAAPATPLRRPFPWRARFRMEGTVTVPYIVGAGTAAAVPSVSCPLPPPRPVFREISCSEREPAASRQSTRRTSANPISLDDRRGRPPCWLRSLCGRVDAVVRIDKPSYATTTQRGRLERRRGRVRRKQRCDAYW
jgi:hypothetical protein